ncbi:MAG: SBBP repeat-containing protein [Cytophagales bacterium]|nr:SBBP repeat-containing protein [Cytophagales bacterium]
MPGIAHDDLGNVYVTGRFTGTIDFDPGVGVTNLTSAGALDTYITKVDAAGNLVWARRGNGANDVYSFDVAVDEAGNVYVTGAFSGTADFDPGPGTSTLLLYGLFFDDIFVLKLDARWRPGLG